MTSSASPANSEQRISPPQGDANSSTSSQGADTQPNASKPAHKIRKLAPPRPFPTVPTSVSATGPRSAHTEGKNYICITRRTNLGAYLRRCKDVFMKDGYKTLHLSAMGAAIPHLMQLALSLPPILPFPQDEIHTEVLTGTVEVQDEVIPEDEDEDITYRTREVNVSVSRRTAELHLGHSIRVRPIHVVPSLGHRRQIDGRPTDGIYTAPGLHIQAIARPRKNEGNPNNEGVR
ncbi:hypothetical protein A0H81_04850 [Grifola frondosa]|uniref:Uncharacterized protein n=1 Tax=Grifola frondosa TaxID=5627 RepID=A0A1C7MFG9_GRIFR|nr:hypothetical protein A0H81_04850 [Grifola frondosa]